jgi:protein TonB
MTGKLVCLAVVLLPGMGLLAQPQPAQVPPRVQEQRLLRRVRPVYPELAKKARIQGAVRLAVLIDEEGVVQRIKLISGHPLLVEAAIDAVRQWRYRPFWQDGEPVGVLTVVTVNFSMGNEVRPLPRPRYVPV